MDYTATNVVFAEHSVQSFCHCQLSGLGDTKLSVHEKEVLGHTFSLFYSRIDPLYVYNLV